MIEKYEVAWTEAEMDQAWTTLTVNSQEEAFALAKGKFSDGWTCVRIQTILVQE